MSVFGVEKALWDISRDRTYADAYRGDPATFLARYQVEPTEAAWIRAMDVRALSDRGVNPMMLMQAWNTLIGADAVGEYLSRMNGKGVNHG